MKSMGIGYEGVDVGVVVVVVGRQQLTLKSGWLIISCLSSLSLMDSTTHFKTGRVPDLAAR